MPKIEVSKVGLRLTSLLGVGMQRKKWGYHVRIFCRYFDERTQSIPVHVFKELSNTEEFLKLLTSRKIVRKKLYLTIGEVRARWHLNKNNLPFKLIVADRNTDVNKLIEIEKITYLINVYQL